MEAIQAKNLTKIFKTKIKREGFKGSLISIFCPEYKVIRAVNDISFTVGEGEIVAFIGPNGAGKSTTIKMMTGILMPTYGYINVLGLNPSLQRKRLAFKIGTVFGQKSQLWFHLPPVDTFKLLGSIYEIDGKELKNRISYLTEVFELKDLMNIPVRKMSLGQRIRCEIAASLLHKPRIIFLDEPTIGLDVVVKQKIRELIKMMNREEKVTVFLTSHDVGDIEQICERVIIINNGSIVLDEPVKNLKYNYFSKKIIGIRYNEKPDYDFGDFKIIKDGGLSLKIEVDTAINSIDDIVSKLIKAGRVADITIEDVPLEDIITMIYSESDKGEAAYGAI